MGGCCRLPSSAPPCGLHLRCREFVVTGDETKLPSKEEVAELEEAAELDRDPTPEETSGRSGSSGGAGADEDGAGKASG